MWRNRWHIFWQAFLFTCAASYANELVFQWFYAGSAEINSLSFAIAAGTQRSDLHVSHIHCLVKSQCLNILCLGLLGTIARNITLWVKFKQRFMLTQETSFIQKYFYYICQSVHTLFLYDVTLMHAFGHLFVILSVMHLPLHKLISNISIDRLRLAGSLSRYTTTFRPLPLPSIFDCENRATLWLLLFLGRELQTEGFVDEWEKGTV